MERAYRAFTLIELLVVIAVIAIVAALLFPVFARSRSVARKTVCISNFKQMGTAVLMYTQDYDETYPIASWQFIDAKCNNPPPILQNLLSVYGISDKIWNCPEDPATERRREVSLCDDVSPPTNSTQAMRDAAWRADFAYNWQYFAPVGKDCDGFKGTDPVSVPVSMVSRPAESIYATDSVWWRLPDGTPDGGGEAAVDPPCRYDANGTDTFTYPIIPGCRGRAVWGGWLPSKPLDWQVYGGVYPWHLNMVNVAWADGHVKTRTLGAISAGCEVRDSFGGRITDPEKYLWDLN